jgi:nucleotide-binding universal stress UspA family protein
MAIEYDGHPKKGRPFMKFDKILAPIDFSPNSEPALALAAELARAVDASLTIVYVYNPTPHEVPAGMPALAIFSAGDVIPEFNKLLEGAKLRAEQAGAARVTTQLLQGLPYLEIVRLAEQQSYGMIVMGTHGRTGFAHMLLGSVAERVVRKAPCPVVTVPVRDSTHKAK